MRQFKPIIVSDFGGGLNIQEHPSRIADNQWTDCNGFMGTEDAAEQLPDINAWSPFLATSNVIGMVANAFSDASIIVGLVGASGQLRLFTVSSGSAIEITRSGGTADPVANVDDVLSTALLASQQIYSGGMSDSFSNRSSLARSSNNTSYSTIDPPASQELRAQEIISFGSHLIAGGVFRSGLDFDVETRKLAWSAANDPTLWLPALDNDADDVTLDDVSGPIIAIVPISQQLVAVMTPKQIHVLRPTERIPAFRRDIFTPFLGAGVGGGGDPERNRLYSAVGTPAGAFFMSRENVYSLTPSVERVGDAIRGYLFTRARLSPETQDMAKPLTWHSDWQQVLIPRPANVTGEVQILLFNPTTRAWGKFDLVSTGFSSGTPHRLAVIDGALYVSEFDQISREDTATLTGYPGAFVDTKDFSFADEAAHLGRIILDMEGSSGSSVAISTWSRDQMAPTVWPNSFGHWSHEITPAFGASLGTVSPSSPELHIRPIAAKYHRLRFTPTGRVRIRGFKLSAQGAGDR